MDKNQKLEGIIKNANRIQLKLEDGLLKYELRDSSNHKYIMEILNNDCTIRVYNSGKFNETYTIPCERLREMLSKNGTRDLYEDMQRNVYLLTTKIAEDNELIQKWTHSPSVVFLQPYNKSAKFYKERA